MQKDSIVSRKYATALFGAALKAKAVDAVADDMASLSALIETNPALLRYLESPEERTDTIREFLRKTFESRISPMAYRFLLLLMDKKRIPYIKQIADEFQELVRKHRGIVRARVTTAVPLDADQAGRLREELARLTDRTIEMEARVDPAILGGVIVAYDDQIIDRSVRRGLDELKQDLMKVRVL